MQTVSRKYKSPPCYLYRPDINNYDFKDSTDYNRNKDKINYNNLILMRKKSTTLQVYKE